MGCVCSRKTVYVKSRKYYVCSHLGSGGFSTVEEIEDAMTNTHYALKKIVCHGIEDQQTALREVEYHKKLKHPNIIELVDSEVSEPSESSMTATADVFLILPYFPRGTLAQDLEMRCLSKCHMSQKEILRMFLQICEGVKAFHEAVPEPLAHRDLKTANILLSGNYSPIIMDLGSVAEARVKICGASEAQALQDLASERCSMPYRAPELFTVESYCIIDERTDIWSLGCILYAMCYFKSPFDVVYERGDSVALAVMSQRVDFPATTPFSQDMHDLIVFMLKVNPMERPFIYSVIERTQELVENNQPRV